MWLGCALAAWGAACGPAEAPVSISKSVVHTLGLGREDPKGVVTGFNLDGFVSDSRDGRSCFQNDFMSPEGEEGVDNQLATLLPLIDLAGEGALDALLQQAINEGRALMIFDVVQPPGAKDGQVTLTVSRGDDRPLLGADSKLLAGQTLALHEMPMLGHTESATLKDTKLVAGPMEVQLPIVVFGILYSLTVLDARIEATLTADGALVDGRLGGAVTLEEVFRVATTAGERTGGLEMLLGSGIRGSADMLRNDDGECEGLSVGVSFDTAPVFTF